MSESDIYDKVLAAQKEFYSAISDVRREISQENRESRVELTALFTHAHEENKERMTLILNNIQQHVTEYRDHVKLDDKRFGVLNRALWLAIGGFTVLITLLQLYDTFLKGG